MGFFDKLLDGLNDAAQKAASSTENSMKKVIRNKSTNELKYALNQSNTTDMARQLIYEELARRGE